MVLQPEQGPNCPKTRPCWSSVRYTKPRHPLHVEDCDMVYKHSFCIRWFHQLKKEIHMYCAVLGKA